MAISSAIKTAANVAANVAVGAATGAVVGATHGSAHHTVVVGAAHGTTHHTLGSAHTTHTTHHTGARSANLTVGANQGQWRQQTYVGNSLTIDDIAHANERRLTTVAVGKERVDSSYTVKPVKTSKKVSDISSVKLPKGSVAVGQIDMGHKVIIEEPKEVVKYVEKEVEVEEIVYQPRITQEIIQRDVPIYYDEEVEENVEVEQIVYQDQIVEEFIDKVTTIEKPIPRSVERKIPVTLTIPRIIEKVIEKVIEVPSGEIVHKEVKIHKEKINHKRRFVEKPVPIVVAHEIFPIVSHDPHIVREVEVLDHYPVITPVDVHIAKPSNINVRAVGHGKVTHRVVTVPAAHYNTMLKKLNPQLHEDLPLFMEDGVIPMLNQELSFLYPPADAEIHGFNAFAPAFTAVHEADLIHGHHSTTKGHSTTVTHVTHTDVAHTDVAHTSAHHTASAQGQFVYPDSSDSQKVYY